MYMISAVNRRQRLNGNNRTTIYMIKWIMRNYRNISLTVVFFLLLVLSNKLVAQSSTTIPKQKIAVFAPLYLDSAFDSNNNYRYDKIFPKFINPGLEFYEGIQLALDSLNKEKTKLEVFVFDTRSTVSLQQQLSTLDSVGLIIAHATAQESWQLAEAARIRKIPYINVNFPNDAGITNNPWFVMLNPSIKTHMEGIYRYSQKYYSLNTVIVFRKKGQMEEIIKNYITDFGKSTMSVPLKLKFIDLIDSFTVKQVSALFDSTRQNVCIAASLDDNFNRRLITQIAAVGKSYHSTIIGMPTFDNLTKEFSKSEYKGPELIYGNPFYLPKTDKISVEIINHFNTKMYARPTDMVFRGYEVLWKYAKLLLQYKSDLSSNLNNKNYKVFTDFDLQPILNKENMTMEYFENKKLYFIKWQDGVIKTVN